RPCRSGWRVLHRQSVRGGEPLDDLLSGSSLGAAHPGFGSCFAEMVNGDATYGAGLVSPAQRGTASASAESALSGSGPDAVQGRRRWPTARSAVRSRRGSGGWRSDWVKLSCAVALVPLDESMCKVQIGWPSTQPGEEPMAWLPPLSL